MRSVKSYTNFKISFPDEGVKRVVHICSTTDHLCFLRKFHPTTHYEGPEMEQSYISTLSYTSAVDRACDQRHGPTTLTLGNRPDTHCTGGCVCPKSSVKGCENSAPPPLPPGQDPWPSSPKRVATPTEPSRPIMRTVYGPSTSILSVTNRDRSRRHNEPTHSANQVLTCDTLTQIRHCDFN